MSLSRKEKEQSRRLKRRQRQRVYGAALIAGMLIAAAVSGVWLLGDRGQKHPLDESGNAAAEASRSDNAAPPKGNASETSGTAGSNEQNSPDAQTTNSPNAEPGTSASKGDDIRLAFVGDIMFADTVERLLEKQGYDYPYSYVKASIASADVAVGNLETPVTDKGSPSEKKEYIYRSSPKALAPLADSGFDVLNLANNHAMDYGVTGLLDTIKRLKDNKLASIGAGSNAEEAYRPHIVAKNGVRVAFLGFSRIIPKAEFKATAKNAGLAETYDIRTVEPVIRKAKEQADLVVVMAHWGNEREDKPVEYQQVLAHQYIDAGADLVVASHPHVLQGFERYKGKWIAYSLGNFIFTKNPNPKTWDSGILHASCGKGGECSLQFEPVLTEIGRPVPVDEPNAKRIFAHLTDISTNANVDDDGKVVAR